MKQRFLRAESLEPRAMLSVSLPTGPTVGEVQPTDAQLGQVDPAPQVAPQEIVLAGDFNGDNVVNNIDIDMLSANFGTPTKSFYDLTSDGVVDKQDMDMLIRDVIGTEYGDADLDGYVGPWDAVTMFRSMLFGGAGWAAGDFSSDGVIDGQDFIEWNRFKFTETAMQRARSARTEVTQHKDTAAESKHELQSTVPTPSLTVSPSQESKAENSTQGDPPAKDLAVADQNVVAESKSAERSAAQDSSSAATRSSFSASARNELVPRQEARLRLRTMRFLG